MFQSNYRLLNLDLKSSICRFLSDSSSMARLYTIFVMLFVVVNLIELESYTVVTTHHYNFSREHEKLEENSQSQHKKNKNDYNSLQEQNRQHLEWSVVKNGLEGSRRHFDIGMHNRRKHKKDLPSKKKNRKLRKNRRKKLRGRTVNLNNYQQDQDMPQQRIPLIIQSKEQPILQENFMLQQSDKQKNIYEPRENIVEEKVLTKLHSQNASRTKDFCSLQRTHKSNKLEFIKNSK